MGIATEVILMFKLLKVCNKSQREYPGAFTPEEENIIIDWCRGTILHLFAGTSKIGEVRIDSTPTATHNQDVFTFLESSQNIFQTIILDPPYNKRYAQMYIKLGGRGNFIMGQKGTKHLFKLICQLHPERIIIKSWGYYGLEKQNYIMHEGYVCYAGGYRKPTFLLLYTQIHHTLNFKDKDIPKP
jgi:hypothetical protein